MDVTLTPEEVFHGAVTGVRRRMASLEKHYKDKQKSSQPAWNIDLNGAIGEIAFAKITKQYWSPNIDTFKDPDVGEIQVRSTSWLNGGLFVRHADSSRYWYALMVGGPYRWKYIGGIFGDQAKAKLHRNKEDDAWLVKQQYLTYETGFLEDQGP